jgi:hypothetical protein
LTGQGGSDMAVAPRILFAKKPTVISLLPYFIFIFIMVECIAFYYSFSKNNFEMSIGINIFVFIALICYKLYIVKVMANDVIILKQITKGSVKDANYRIRQIM